MPCKIVSCATLGTRAIGSSALALLSSASYRLITVACRDLLARPSWFALERWPWFIKYIPLGLTKSLCRVSLHWAWWNFKEVTLSCFFLWKFGCQVSEINLRKNICLIKTMRGPAARRRWSTNTMVQSSGVNVVWNLGVLDQGKKNDSYRKFSEKLKFLRQFHQKISIFPVKFSKQFKLFKAIFQKKLG